MKKAILVAIDDTIKVILGTTVKAIKIDEVLKDESRRFLDKLFADFEVLTVETMSPLSKDDFFISIDDLVRSSGPPARMEPIAQPSRPSPAALAVQPAAKPAAKKGNGVWYRSISETTFMLDDILTDKVVRRGGAEFKQPAIIYPNRAINLLSLDPEQVKKSACIKKLIQDGDIVPCTEAEAKALEKKRFEAESNIPRGFGGISGACVEDSEADLNRQSRAEAIEIGRKGPDNGVIDLGEFSDATVSEESQEIDMEEILKGT